MRGCSARLGGSAAELAIVNRVGQALSAQLDLDALIDLVGEQMRETFAADIVYVALLDAEAGEIQFPYYFEDGRSQDQPALAFGTGLTSRIRARADAAPAAPPRGVGEALGDRGVGTQAMTYLGVPILRATKRSASSASRAPRRRAASARTTSGCSRRSRRTSASRSQNARLYEETHRRAARDGGARRGRSRDLREPGPDGGPQQHRGARAVAARRSIRGRVPGPARRRDAPGDRGARAHR